MQERMTAQKEKEKRKRLVKETFTVKVCRHISESPRRIMRVTVGNVMCELPW